MFRPEPRARWLRDGISLQTQRPYEGAGVGWPFPRRRDFRGVDEEDATAGEARGIAGRPARRSGCRDLRQPRVTRALLRRLQRMCEVVRGVDERDMREGLREVADEAPRFGIIFLGE
jgi:hypothetical protein